MMGLSESTLVSGKNPSNVLWVTNLAAPYRIPVWRYLAGSHLLTVALLESNEGLKHDSAANRGRDWLHESSGDLTFRELPSWKWRRGEGRYYTLRSLRPVFDVRKFDIVLFGGWESPAYWSLLASAIVFRTARVGFYESPSNTQTHRSGAIAWLRTRFFRAMDIVVVPGHAAADAVLEMGVRPRKLLQGFNAVNVAQFHQAALSTAGIESEGLRGGHRFLYAGRLIPLKRVNEIISAFVEIAEPDDELTIVGTGPLSEELRAIANLSEAKVRFMDPVENGQMPAVMVRNHTLVLASEREVWGLVVNEALASGMHVVVTENCGVIPSVRAMHGVYPAREDLTDLAKQMEASKVGWIGRISQPEILRHTPERLAEVFDAAFVSSLKLRRRRIRQNSESDAN